MQAGREPSGGLLDDPEGATVIADPTVVRCGKRSPPRRIEYHLGRGFESISNAKIIEMDIPQISSDPDRASLGSTSPEKGEQ